MRVDSVLKLDPVAFYEWWSEFEIASAVVKFAMVVM